MYKIGFVKDPVAYLCRYLLNYMLGIDSRFATELLARPQRRVSYRNAIMLILLYYTSLYRNSYIC